MPFLPHRKVIMQLNMRSFESFARRDKTNYSEVTLISNMVDKEMCYSG